MSRDNVNNFTIYKTENKREKFITKFILPKLLPQHENLKKKHSITNSHVKYSITIEIDYNK